MLKKRRARIVIRMQRKLIAFSIRYFNKWRHQRTILSKWMIILTFVLAQHFWCNFFKGEIDSANKKRPTRTGKSLEYSQERNLVSSFALYIYYVPIYFVKWKKQEDFQKHIISIEEQIASWTVSLAHKAIDHKVANPSLIK